MGAAPATPLGVALALALVMWPRPAAAEPTCTGETSSGSRFATCFDPGNRLVLFATTDGAGGVIHLRHAIHFDDEPDLVWKMDHRLLATTAGGAWQRYAVQLYRGRYLRHARDGHIVLPFSTSRKLFLPFDIGAETDVGTVAEQPGDPTLHIGVVRAAALIDLARSDQFNRRLALGVVASWDLDASVDERRVIEHRVTPLSAAIADAYWESQNGLTSARLRLEAGSTWASQTGWTRSLGSSARLERVILALNDRPLSLVAGGRYDSARGEVLGEVGLAFALFSRRHRRVILAP